MRVKKVAITGATGMIGATLTRKFIDEGIQVIAIARPNSLKMNNIPLDPLVEVIQCSADKFISLKEISCQCDLFYHFAWEGTFGDSRNDVYLQNKNIKNTLDAVTIANAWGAHSFIGAGSQAEYGLVEAEKISPTLAVNPETGYGVAKYAAGKLSAMYAEKLEMRHVWGRIFSVYGPMDNDFTMIISTIDKLLNGEVPCFTAGEQQWDYLFSEDAAEAFYLLGLSGKDQAEYCIGGGLACPLKDYILVLRDAIDKSLPLGFGKIPYLKNQVMQLCADIQNLVDDTGFVPKVSFEQGITETIQWVKETRGL